MGVINCFAIFFFYYYFTTVLSSGGVSIMDDLDTDELNKMISMMLPVEIKKNEITTEKREKEIMNV